MNYKLSVIDSRTKPGALMRHQFWLLCSSVIRQETGMFLHRTFTILQKQTWCLYKAITAPRDKPCRSSLFQGRVRKAPQGIEWLGYTLRVESWQPGRIVAARANSRMETLRAQLLTMVPCKTRSIQRPFRIKSLLRRLFVTMVGYWWTNCCIWV